MDIFTDLHLYIILRNQGNMLCKLSSKLEILIFFKRRKTEPNNCLVRHRVGLQVIMTKSVIRSGKQNSGGHCEEVEVHSSSGDRKQRNQSRVQAQTRGEESRAVKDSQVKEIFQ